jgi:hypothetical protein
MVLSHRVVVQAKERHKEVILAKPNVVGVGLGYKDIRGQITDELAVVALVIQKVPKAGLHPDSRVPSEVDGIVTDVIQVGELRALSSHTDRIRPIPGGVSIGHYKVTAGTLGCVVYDKDTRERLILSNNHVLAESNNGLQGDPILQPGPIDGGRVAKDTVATLERFYPIQFATGPASCELALLFARVGNTIAQLVGSKYRVETYWHDEEATNRVDAAVAKPLEGVTFLDEIMDIGVVAGTVSARLGMLVRKTGRTTGFTSGQIIVIEATVNIRYGHRTARFDGQIISGPMSKPGDSGSLLLASDTLLAVGLLFAGSDQATVHNPIQEVLDSLKVVI